MDNDRPKTDSVNVPLMASIARRIMEELFHEQPVWRRADLAAQVERIHLERGGLKGKQDPQRIVKKALQILEEDGKVESAAYGHWRWKPEANQDVGPSPLDGVVPDRAATSFVQQGGEELTPEKEIGEGPEGVYVYYNRND